MPRPPRWVAALAAVALPVMALTGCQSSPREDAEQAATAFARALTDRSLTDAPIGGASAASAQEEFDAITKDLAEGDLSVTATDVTENGPAATATLNVQWTLPAFAEPWSYSAPVTLARHDEDGSKQWLVDWSPTVIEPSLQAGEALSVVVSASQDGRADILGNNGEQLVTERPVIRVGIDKPSVTGSAAAAAEQLASVFDMDPGTYAAKVEASGPKAYVDLITVRDDGSYAPELARCSAIDGCLQLAATRSLAPTAQFARPILGTTGEATAEILDASNGTISAGDIVGLSGLQRQFDSRLRPQPRAAVIATAADGSTRELHTQEAAPAQPVGTTLDSALQTRAEQVLADVGPASAIVAVRPSDGHVLAAASGSGSDGYSTALLGQYAPGSTFKVVTALALLRNGYTPDTTVHCPETVTVDGRTFKNFPGYPASALGDVSLTTAFANSCNTALITAAQDVSQQDLVDAAAALGVGADAVKDIGFDSYLGDVPAEASKTEHAASAIGQGKITMSPLAMATIAASVAEGGKVAPVLITNPAPNPTVSTPSHPLTATEADQLRALMRAVVTDGGGTILAPLDPPVLAKTGTAQYGSDDPPATHTWMIAIQGDLAVAAFVDTGVSGAQTAGPLIRDFLTTS